MTPQCHVSILLKISIICLDLPRLNGKKAKTVFFRLQHTHFTVFFLKSNLLFLRQLVICDTVPLINLVTSETVL